MNQDGWKIVGVGLLIVAFIALFDPECRGLCKRTALRLVDVGAGLI